MHVYWISAGGQLKLSTINLVVSRQGYGDPNYFSKGMKMSIPNETLKAMIRDYNGLELSDDELELVRPELDIYLSELKNLESLDLSNLFSGRLMQLPVSRE